MHVSLMTHEEFQAKVTSLDVAHRTTKFGEETSLWFDDQLCALGFGEHKKVLEDLKSQFPTGISYGKRTHIPDNVQALLLVGTPFQGQVWKALLNLTPGSTSTYKNIAQSIGSPQAVRAVGTAIGRNPVSVHVPCHRVIRTDGGMGGYRWGLDVKQKLLDEEKAA